LKHHPDIISQRQFPPGKERELNHICIPSEIGYPTISDSQISMSTALRHAAFPFWQTYRQTNARKRSKKSPALTLKAHEIEIELTNVCGDEALQIYAVKKGRTRFLQERRELGGEP
jgi:hypothetical protein